MASKSRKRVTVYIGRFQPLHNGHCYNLEQAFKTSDAVIILVGSAYQARTIKNPFTFSERSAMIVQWIAKSQYSHKTYSVSSLRDQPYNDAKWIQSVQEEVESSIARFTKIDPDYEGAEVFLTGSDRDSSTWYLNAFPQYKLDLKPAVPPGEDLNATGLRKRLFADNNSQKEQRFVPFLDRRDWADVPDVTFSFLETFQRTHHFRDLCREFLFIEDYKKGWAVAPYPPTFLTADSVIVQSGHILVVERGEFPGKGLWALPGGFVKQNQRILEAAVNEVTEETGLRLAEGKRAKEITHEILKGSIRGQEYFDHPDRSLRGRTVTVTFLFRLDDSKPLPKVKGMFAPLEETGGKKIVETRKAFWLQINEARRQSEKWFEDHHAMVDTMLGLIKD